jgi:hypothetical protein
MMPRGAWYRRLLLAALGAAAIAAPAQASWTRGAGDRPSRRLRDARPTAPATQIGASFFETPPVSP